MIKCNRNGCAERNACMAAENEVIYIVAGDEMQKLFAKVFPDYQTIPFREDFSKGSCDGVCFNEKMIADRASFWGVAKEAYLAKMSPIIDLDLSRTYVLTFGNDSCCAANLKFMIGFLKCKGYAKPIRVRIVNEYDLTVLQEYTC